MPASAGALYSGLLGFVSPEGFDLFQMIIQKAMIVVGGLGSVVGSVLGASLLVYVMEFLREFKSTQEIVFGALLVAFMVFQPHGLVVFMKRWLPGWEEPLHVAWSDRSQSVPEPGAVVGRHDLRSERVGRADMSILAVDGVSISFGGVRALDSGLGHVRRRRDCRHHRAQRRRQDDAPQRHLRPEPARCGRIRLEDRRDHRHEAQPDRRHGAWRAPSRPRSFSPACRSSRT